jgi:hypothetical protein
LAVISSTYDLEAEALHARDIAINEPILCIKIEVAPKTARTIAVQHLALRISEGMHVACVKLESELH